LLGEKPRFIKTSVGWKNEKEFGGDVGIGRKGRLEGVSWVSWIFSSFESVT
jgi:hypothetical protein